MKYLKLYEAFKSKGISNTLKFLKQKVGQYSTESFIDTLKLFMDNIDFPIDKISDDNIKYMSAKKALTLKKEEPVTNEKGIWVIKYWFSLDKGFLGYSATGNEERDLTTNNSSGNDGLREQRKFTDSELEYIKENITRTGEIWPVSDYNKLKTGDTVIGLFDSSSYTEKFSFAKIFVDEEDSNRVYGIQGVADGSQPLDDSWRNYRQFGNLSWWMYRNRHNNDIGNDHMKLYYWRESQDELHYIEPPVESKKEDEVEEIKEVDPLTYNLPLSNRFSFSSWGRGSSITKNDIEKADFALVLYFDDLINPEVDAEHYERPSDTREVRRQEKEGATKLMSDAEIKKMNIERYIQKLVVSLNITETEFYNLEKIVSKNLSQEFSYISIWIQRPDWTDLGDFANYLYQIVDENDNDKPYYLERVKKMYSDTTKRYYEQLIRYQESKKYLKDTSNLKKIFDEIFKLGNEINAHFVGKELNSIDDLWLCKKRIQSLYDFMKMSRNSISYQIREVFNGFRYPEEMSYYYNTYKDQYTEYNKDLEKLNRVRAFLKSL